jgi:hypothetical protein
MNIEIHTRDNHLSFDLFDATAMEQGQSFEIAEGVTAEYFGTVKRYAIDWPDVVEIGITVALTVPAGVAVNWITKWLIGKPRTNPEKLVIDKIEVEYDAEEIKRIVHEKITWERE